MSEIRGFENAEKMAHRPEPDNFRQIKPETSKSLEERMAFWDKLFSKESPSETSVNFLDKEGLTDKEKIAIKKETGWSDEIIDCIKDMEQYEIYKKADLVEAEVNGRECLVKRELDLDYVSEKTIDDEHPDGISNRDLMKEGNSPYDAKTGEKIELHHMGQKYDSPFAELCENSEHGDGKHGILHNLEGESWRRDSQLKTQYNNHDRPNHWKERSEG